MQVLYCPLQFEFSTTQCAESSKASTAELSIHLFSITTSPALKTAGCWSLLQLSNGRVWLHPGQVANKSQQSSTPVNSLELPISSMFMSFDPGRMLQYLHRTSSKNNRSIWAHCTVLLLTKCSLHTSHITCVMFKVTHFFLVLSCI